MAIFSNDVSYTAVEKVLFSLLHAIGIKLIDETTCTGYNMFYMQETGMLLSVEDDGTVMAEAVYPGKNNLLIKNRPIEEFVESIKNMPCFHKGTEKILLPTMKLDWAGKENLVCVKLMHGNMTVYGTYCTKEMVDSDIARMSRFLSASYAYKFVETK